MENSNGNGITSLVPNIQLFADGEAAQTGTGTTSAATAETGTTAPTNDGTGTQTATAPTVQTTTEEAKPFKAFASQSEFDNFVQQTLKSREESLKAKLTPEIKAQLDKESKMTADQKVQAQLDQLESDKKALAKEKNRIKAESLLVSKGITDEVSRSVMLDSVVGEDETESLKRTQALVDVIDKATNEKIKVAMKDVKAPNAGADTGGEKGKETIGKILGERRAKVSETANKTLDYYINGGKKA